MELLNVKEFVDYLKANYACIHKGEQISYGGEFDGFCEPCNKEVFFKSRTIAYSSGYSDSIPEIRFSYYLVECPRCHRKSFLHLVEVDNRIINPPKTDDDDETYVSSFEVYKLGYIPIQLNNYELKDIPAEYTSLHETVAEAMFTLEHGKNISSAILFRRAIQILAKDILGATGRTLHLQLEWLKTNPNLLSINLGDLFHENAKLIKDVGNQGAHPDEDITLQNFSTEDVHCLHDLFLAIVNEVFIKPKRDQEVKAELRNRRKLKP